MKRQLLLKRLLFIVLCVGVYAVLSWAGNISEVRLIAKDTVEMSMIPVAQKCVDSFKDQSLWSISDNEVQATVSACDVTFKEATIHHLFPRKLEVEIRMFRPVVKIDKADAGCMLLLNSSKQISLPSERCGSYDLPVLTGPGVDNNVFVQEYVAELARELISNGVKVKTIEFKGDAIAPWYVLGLLPGGKAYFPSSAAITDKVLVLAASLDGLNAAKERYSIVDVRFDRVVYK
jgi:cell division septal protein FtsQ